MAYVPTSTLKHARAMRAQPTDAERRLWSLLKGRQVEGLGFRRQHPVGPYILDFACVEAKLVVEADGGQHNASTHDHARDAYLRVAGWRVLRLWNTDILTNTDGVAETIRNAVLGDPP